MNGGKRLLKASHFGEGMGEEKEEGGGWGGGGKRTQLIFSRRKISMQQSQHYCHSAIESIVYSAIESMIDSF